MIKFKNKVYESVFSYHVSPRDYAQVFMFGSRHLPLEVRFHTLSPKSYVYSYSFGRDSQRWDFKSLAWNSRFPL